LPNHLSSFTHFPRFLRSARKYLPNIFHYFQLFALRTPTKNEEKRIFLGVKEEEGWATGLSGCFVLEFINETHWVGFAFWALPWGPGCFGSGCIFKPGPTL